MYFDKRRLRILIPPSVATCLNLGRALMEANEKLAIQKLSLGKAKVDFKLARTETFQEKRC